MTKPNACLRTPFHIIFLAILAFLTVDLSRFSTKNISDFAEVKHKSRGTYFTSSWFPVVSMNSESLCIPYLSGGLVHTLKLILFIPKNQCPIV